MKTLELIDNIGAGEYRDGSSTKKGWTYQPMGDFFPELARVRVHCAAAVRRTFAAVRDAGGHGGALIDLGCSTGYYLAGLRDLYDLVLGWEADETAVAAGRSLGLDCRHASHPNSIELQSAVSPLTVLTLNVQMWWHKQGVDVDMMTMVAAHADRLFFQTATLDSGGRYKFPITGIDAEAEYLSRWWETLELIDETTHHGGIRRLWKCQQPRR